MPMASRGPGKKSALSAERACLLHSLHFRELNQVMSFVPAPLTGGSRRLELSNTGPD
jgi:hypothetical protein